MVNSQQRELISLLLQPHLQQALDRPTTTSRPLRSAFRRASRISSVMKERAGRLNTASWFSPNVILRSLFLWRRFSSELGLKPSEDSSWWGVNGSSETSASTMFTQLQCCQCHRCHLHTSLITNISSRTVNSYSCRQWAVHPNIAVFGNVLATAWKNAIYSEVSHLVSPVLLRDRFHREPPHVKITARMNSRPQSLTPYAGSSIGSTPAASRHTANTTAFHIVTRWWCQMSRFCSSFWLFTMSNPKLLCFFARAVPF